MNALTSFASTPIVQSVGWTLLHFLWQGCLIAGILAVVLLLLRKRSAEARYAASCLAMLLMAVAPIVTCVLLAGPPAGWFAGSDVPQAVFLVASGETHQQTVIKTALPYVVATWLVGVVLLLIRLTGGWFQVQRLKREMLCNPDGGWPETVDRLSRRLGLRSVVRIVESAAASVPTVIGWIRPIILMPVAAVCGLSPQQLEVVIAHELAHIRRHDYLVNLLQSVMETLLFYHPGVWWVSGRMREEREYCCDDLAVAVCGDPLRYAQVLTDLETLRGATLHLGLSSTGGALMNRVTRLVGLHATRSRRGSLWILTAFAMTAAAGVASVAGHSLIRASDNAGAPKSVMVKLDLQTVGEEREGHFIWVTSETPEGDSHGVWVMDETVEGEAHGVWVTALNAYVEAAAQAHVEHLMLAKVYENVAVESVDEKEESGGFSLLSLADRLFAHYVTLRSDDEGQAAVVEFIAEADDSAQSAEATVSITVERSDRQRMWLERAYVQLGELHLIADQIEIEIGPTVEAGHRLEIVPIIESGKTGSRIELKFELLPNVHEGGKTPLTVRFESRGTFGTWVTERGDGEGAERLHRVYLNVVKPTAEVHLEAENQPTGSASAMQRYVRIVFERMLGAQIEARVEYHILREIYVDAKEGVEARVKVLIKVEEDESGDQ